MPLIANDKKSGALEYLALVFILLIMVAIVIPSNVVGDNPVVYFTFSINGLLWVGLLLIELSKRSISFVMIEWIFCLLFFFYAPIVQYANGQFAWHCAQRPDDILIHTNIVLFVWSLCFLAGSILPHHKYVVGDRALGRSESDRNGLTTNSVRKKLLLLTFINIVILLYRIRTVGFVALFSRATVDAANAINGSNSAASAIVGQALRAISCFTTILSINYYRENKSNLFIPVINFICLFIAYAPTGMARYATAAIYGGIFFTMFPSFKQGKKFVFLFLVAFVLVLPSLNAFRREAFGNVNILGVVKSIFNGFSKEWLKGDYDAYTMLTLAIENAKKCNLEPFKQLLGCLLFWIPRTIWPGKPAGSGYTLAQYLGWQFKNVSCCLPAEGYMNFGILGMVIFAVIAGKLSSKIDEGYWNSSINQNASEPLYFTVLFMFFFINRGDLLSSFSYTVAFVLTWTIIEKFLDL